MKVSTYKHLYEMEISKHKQMASPRALRPLDGAYVVLDGPYVAHFHNSPNEIFCSMAHYIQNHLLFDKIKDLAREYFFISNSDLGPPVM
jgi:hypothetical protein